MSKLVRLGENSYAELSRVAGSLQMRAKRVISLDEAVAYLCAREGGNSKSFWKRVSGRKEARGRPRKAPRRIGKRVAPQRARRQR